MKSIGLIALSLIVLSGCESMKKSDGTKTSAASKSKSKASKNEIVEGAVNCSFHNEKRSIENKATNGGCEVVYTKAGAAQTVASSAKGTSHCSEVTVKMKAKLEAGGWSCQ